MAVDELAVRDRIILVPRFARTGGFHRDIVVPGIDHAVGDEKIPPRRIDPVRVVGVARRLDGDSLDRHIRAILGHQMKHRRVAQGHAVDAYASAVGQFDHVRAVRH